jgi:hypothetical protein
MPGAIAFFAKKRSLRALFSEAIFLKLTDRFVAKNAHHDDVSF